MSGTMLDFDESCQDAATGLQTNDYLSSPRDIPEPDTALPAKSSDIPCDDPTVSSHYIDLYPHLRPVAPQSERACDGPSCGELFRFARDLNIHLMKKYKRSQHTCSVYGRLFRDGTRLQHHLETHFAKELICSFEQCGRFFARPDSLSRHRKIFHSKEKPRVWFGTWFQERDATALSMCHGTAA